MRFPKLSVLLALLLALTALGCGSEKEGEPAGLSEADVPSREDFPAPAGKTLQQLASDIQAGPEIGLATSQYTVGKNRMAFGVIDGEGNFVYAPTAVYVSRGPNAPATGPFLAPTDSLTTEPQFRSRGAAIEASPLAAIYSAQVSLPQPGRYAVLVASRIKGKLFGGSAEITARRDSLVPDVGEKPPEVSTDTAASAGGLAQVETREPPDPFHEVDFADVIGKKPVALLFSTPAFCESRVCGPVTDIAVQLAEEYGDEVEFIHQEVFKDNDPSKGVRPQLTAFRLPSEPWLFTFDEEGRVAARLEGSFGLEAFEEALKQALN